MLNVSDCPSGSVAVRVVTVEPLVVNSAILNCVPLVKDGPVLG